MTTTMLQEVSDAIGAVAASVGPSVVGIGGRARGSGVVIAAGRVVTNAHNLRGAEVRITFADGRSAGGSVAGVDLDGDLAVIDVDTGDAPAVAWADDGADPALGAVVFALARGRGLRVTTGYVSSVSSSFRGPRGRRITDATEHTAPLARGSSGGPIVDDRGRLLGLNTHRRGDGFYLAIPATSDLREHLDVLGRGEVRAPVRLGIAVAPSSVAHRMRAAVGLPERDGLLVRGVAESGPARDGGIERGDLIVAADGRPLGSSDDLFAILDELDPAAGTLDLTVVRGADEVTVTIRFDG